MIAASWPNGARNTGARVQEATDVRVEHLDLEPPAKVHLHGKGDKWRICPLWNETVKHLGSTGGLCRSQQPCLKKRAPIGARRFHRVPERRDYK